MSLNCLLLHGPFSEFSFSNFAAAYRIAGCRYTTPPLGLLTVAALLPESWELRLADLNVRALDEDLLDWADLVLLDGMITQQLEVKALIQKVHTHGKPVVLGGPDASVQPGIYRQADFLVLDEGEITVPRFLEAWRAGARSGIFRADGVRADIRLSPVPRFDLVNPRDYLYMGIQASRGCSHDCEFCDIVARLGRPPRCKTPDGVLAELDALLAAGHRGNVDFVDDNFAGNRRAALELLRRLEAWSIERDRPFYFSTSATVSAAWDDELLDLLKRCDFRCLFLGLESPDPDVLRRTGKAFNAMKPFEDGVRRFNEAGISVYAGFILGFDGEQPGAAGAIADSLERSRVVTAIIGLLTSLPGTRLNRRLIQEGRLLVREGGAAVRPGEQDQMTAGLNFTPSRPRAEILREYRDMLLRLYSPRAFFGRLRRSLEWFRPQSKRRTRVRDFPGLVWSLVKATAWFAAHPRLVPQYLRTLASAAPRGFPHFTLAVTFSAFYSHVGRKTRHVVEHLDRQIREVEEFGEDGYNRRRGAFLYQTASESEAPALR